jgi:hypothetical protein
MYELFKRLENGEFVRVSTFEVLEQALQVAEGLHRTWPGKYVLRDSKGNDIVDLDRLKY